MKDVKWKIEIKIGGKITLDDCIYGIAKAKEELVLNYGSLEIELGTLQRHTRGNVNLPVGGAPDVLAAMYTKKQEDGTYRAHAGESYIQLVRFGEKGVEIESINSYGASSKENAENSTTQMNYYADQKLKKMTLNKEKVLKTAVKVYSPMKIKN